MCDQFFVQAGIRPENVRALKKICLQLSMLLHTGVDYFMDMPVTELEEAIAEVERIGKEKHRIRTGHKNRR